MCWVSQLREIDSKVCKLEGFHMKKCILLVWVTEAIPVVIKLHMFSQRVDSQRHIPCQCAFPTCLKCVYNSSFDELQARANDRLSTHVARSLLQMHAHWWYLSISISPRGDMHFLKDLEDFLNMQSPILVRCSQRVTRLNIGSFAETCGIENSRQKIPHPLVFPRWENPLVATNAQLKLQLEIHGPIPRHDEVRSLKVPRAHIEYTGDLPRQPAATAHPLAISRTHKPWRASTHNNGLDISDDDVCGAAADGDGFWSCGQRGRCGRTWDSESLWEGSRAEAPRIQTGVVFEDFCLTHIDFLGNFEVKPCRQRRVRFNLLSSACFCFFLFSVCH